MPPRMEEVYLMFLAAVIGFIIFVVLYPWMGEHKDLGLESVLLITGILTIGLIVTVVQMIRRGAISHPRASTRVISRRVLPTSRGYRSSAKSPGEVENVGGFMETFIRNQDAAYLDTGDYDFGIDGQNVVVRSKRHNTVTTFWNKELKAAWESHKKPAYYLAPAALLVFAYYFAWMFMSRALERESEMLLVLAIFVSPFATLGILELLSRSSLLQPSSRSKEAVVTLLYLSSAIFFISSYGSTQTNPYKEGVFSFFLLGALPYLCYRVVSPIWEEEQIKLTTPTKSLTLCCPSDKSQKLLNLLTKKQQRPESQDHRCRSPHRRGSVADGEAT